MIHSIVLKFEKIWLSGTLIPWNQKCNGRTDMRIPIYPLLSSSGGIKNIFLLSTFFKVQFIHDFFLARVLLYFNLNKYIYIQGVVIL